MKNLFVIATLSVVFFSCGPNKAVVQPEVQTIETATEVRIVEPESNGKEQVIQANEAIFATKFAAVQPTDTFVQIQKTPCMGACPEYSAAILYNGQIIYNGVQNVKVKGKKKAQLTNEQLNQIELSIQQTNYFGLADFTSQALDVPSTITKVNYGGKQKQLTHQMAQSNELALFESFIERLIFVAIQ